MSEEEREIDVELDDRENENDDDLASLGGQYDNKRALHNAMERKRRDSIKDSFKGLQDCIPTLKGDKTSRAQVLKKTGEYITHMQRKITDHQVSPTQVYHLPLQACCSGRNKESEGSEHTAGEPNQSPGEGQGEWKLRECQ